MPSKNVADQFVETLAASQRPPPLLEFKDVNTYYGELHVLKGVDYRAKARSSACSAAMPAENPRP